MTPALLVLARQYMALPGAPRRDPVAHELAIEHPRSMSRLRDIAGILWTRDPDNIIAPWLPALLDDATGGVMLARLPGQPSVLMRGDLVFIEAAGSNGFLIDGENGATLAEAVARVAVALGRAG